MQTQQVVEVHEFVFNQLFKERESSEILVFLKLTQLCGRSRECQVSQKDLAEWVGLSGPAVSHAVNKLIREKLILVTQAKSRNYPATYRVKRRPDDDLVALVSADEPIAFEQMPPEQYAKVKEAMFSLCYQRWLKANPLGKMNQLMNAHFGAGQWSHRQCQDYFRDQVWTPFDNAVTDKEMVERYRQAKLNPAWNLDSWNSEGLP